LLDKRIVIGPRDFCLGNFYIRVCLGGA
jgi:hypothetical protein